MKLLLGHEKAQQNDSTTDFVAGKVSDLGNPSLRTKALPTGRVLRSIQRTFDKHRISLVLSTIESGRDQTFSSS